MSELAAVAPGVIFSRLFFGANFAFTGVLDNVTNV